MIKEEQKDRFTFGPTDGGKRIEEYLPKDLNKNNVLQEAIKEFEINL